MVDIKFCGLTRAEDAEYAVSVGATYAGMIFAGGPRHLTPQAARTVAAATRGAVQTVGVFAQHTPQEIAEIASDVGLDIVQLHGTYSAADVAAVRAVTGRITWGVLRIAGQVLPLEGAELLQRAEGVVLDAHVTGQLGGTGRSFDWDALAPLVHGPKTFARLILAGGLTPLNISQALPVMRPDVVDVSSGVEVAPGVKDHTAMRAFALAVQQWNMEHASR